MNNHVRQLLNYLCVAIAVLFLLSCGEDAKKDSDGGSSSGTPLTSSFMSSSDIQKPSNLESLTRSKMLEALADSEGVYSNEPEDSDDDGDICLKEKSGLAVLSATKSSIKVGIKIDISECAKKWSDSTTTFSDVILKYFMDTRCEGADLSFLDGKSLKELDDDNDVLKTCTRVDQIANTEISGKISQTGDNPATTQMRVVDYKGTSDLNLCTYTLQDKVSTVGSDCIDVSSTTYYDRKINGEDVADLEGSYVKLEAKKLQSLVDQTSLWHNAGTIEARVNNWIGTLSYTDPDEAPTYYMSSSDDEEQGTLQAKTTLLLTDFRSNINRALKKLRR